MSAFGDKVYVVGYSLRERVQDDPCSLVSVPGCVDQDDSDQKCDRIYYVEEVVLDCDSERPNMLEEVLQLKEYALMSVY